MTPEKPRRLGRGLEALLGSAAAPTPAAAVPSSANQNELQRISLSRIRPNPFQPRREFPDAELAELRASLQASGLLQPVVVRPAGDSFELISGERRFRAATQLGWQDIPALVRDADEQTMLTLALIENLQRADLNVVDEARGYHRLHEEFTLTHQQIAEAVGKDRSTVTNLLRLLSLPERVQKFLEQGALTMGHARALLGVSDARASSRLAAEIVAQQLSVRETERRVRDLATPAKPPRNGASATTSKTNDDPGGTSTSPVLRQIQDRLRRHFQTDLRVQASADGKGTIQIAFYSADDLDRILELILGTQSIGD